jgi:hypothetical protein
MVAAVVEEAILRQLASLVVVEIHLLQAHPKVMMVVMVMEGLILRAVVVAEQVDRVAMEHLPRAVLVETELRQVFLELLLLTLVVVVVVRFYKRLVLVELEVVGTQTLMPQEATELITWVGVVVAGRLIQPEVFITQVATAALA